MSDFVDQNGRPLPSKMKPVDEVSKGMNSIFWGIKNPLKSGLRGFGLICAILGSLTVLAGGIYLIKGDQTPARLSAHPGDLGRYGVDKGIRPLWRSITSSQPATDVEQWLYREGQPEQPEQPEDLYRADDI